MTFWLLSLHLCGSFFFLECFPVVMLRSFRNLRWMNKVPFFRDFSLHIASLEELPIRYSSDRSPVAGKIMKYHEISRLIMMNRKNKSKWGDITGMFTQISHMSEAVGFPCHATMPSLRILRRSRRSIPFTIASHHVWVVQEGPVIGCYRPKRVHKNGIQFDL